MNKIDIIPYDTTWPFLYEKEAHLIKQALKDNFLTMHHIGSTSVPKLSAKPILDIITVVKYPTLSIASLEAIGYTYKGEINIPFHFYFSKKESAKIHLHVYEDGNPEIELNLLFRNYLRMHPEALKEYARLKENLCAQQTSFKKINSRFTNYTLGKDAFIRTILEKSGFHQMRLMKCAHIQEWEKAKNFRQKYFFDKNGVSDPYIWTFDHPEHVHFVFYQGIKIIGYAHTQLWPEKRASLRIIVIDSPYRNQGFGEHFLTLCEKWLKHHDHNSIHIESSPEAHAFYIKHGYTEMPFNDPDGYKSDPQDFSLGKVL